MTADELRLRAASLKDKTAKFVYESLAELLEAGHIEGDSIPDWAVLFASNALTRRREDEKWARKERVITILGTVVAPIVITVLFRLLLG